MLFFILISSQLLQFPFWTGSHNWTIQSDLLIVHMLYAAVRGPYLCGAANISCRKCVIVAKRNPIQWKNVLHFAGDIFVCMVLGESLVYFVFQISLTFDHMGHVHSKSLFQVMALFGTGDTEFSKTNDHPTHCHIYASRTWPNWLVKRLVTGSLHVSIHNSNHQLELKPVYYISSKLLRSKSYVRVAQWLLIIFLCGKFYFKSSFVTSIIKKYR